MGKWQKKNTPQCNEGNEGYLRPACAHLKLNFTTPSTVFSEWGGSKSYWQIESTLRPSLEMTTKDWMATKLTQ